MVKLRHSEGMMGYGKERAEVSTEPLARLPLAGRISKS